MPPAYLKGPPGVLPSTNIAYWCAGKERFESPLLAAQVAARAEDKRRDPYRCRSCGGWHIGGGASKAHVASRKVLEQTIR
jgi:hypothetical protein